MIFLQFEIAFMLCITITVYKTATDIVMPILQIHVAFILGIDRFSMDVSLMIGKQIPWFFRFFIVVIAPAVVIVSR